MKWTGVQRPVTDLPFRVVSGPTKGNLSLLLPRLKSLPPTVCVGPPSPLLTLRYRLVPSQRTFLTMGQGCSLLSRLGARRQGYHVTTRTASGRPIYRGVTVWTRRLERSSRIRPYIVRGDEWDEHSLQKDSWSVREEGPRQVRR